MVAKSERLQQGSSCQDSITQQTFNFIILGFILFFNYVCVFGVCLCERKYPRWPESL